MGWKPVHKRELLEVVRYPEGELYEDILVTYEVIKRSVKIAVIGNEDYYYFQRKNSIQNMNFNIHKIDGVKSCYRMMMSIKTDYPRLTEAAKCRYFCTVCNIFFQIKEKKFDDVKKELWNEIKKYRTSVLLNLKARKKARIAAIISYTGYDIMNWCYRKGNRRR